MLMLSAVLCPYFLRFSHHGRRPGPGYALFVLLSILPFAAEAQILTSLPQPKKDSSPLYGLTEKQVEEKFGKPDQVNKKSDASSDWSYGKSSLFFLDGKVSAWSDQGELAERTKEQEVKKAVQPKPKDDLGDEWINPWTPSKKNREIEKNLGEVIDE